VVDAWRGLREVVATETLTRDGQPRANCRSGIVRCFGVLGQ